MASSPRELARALVIVALSSTLVLCLSTLGPWGYASAQEDESQAVQEEPPADAGEGFTYQSLGRRDPFKSLLVLQEKKKDTSNLPPIQQVDLKSFKVVGIIMDETIGSRAMIRAPDGKSYVIKKGNIVGKNEGEVMSIDFDGITVKERFLDYMDNETMVTSVLKATGIQN